MQMIVFFFSSRLGCISLKYKVVLEVLSRCGRHEVSVSTLQMINYAQDRYLDLENIECLPFLICLYIFKISTIIILVSIHSYILCVNLDLRQTKTAIR